MNSQQLTGFVSVLMSATVGEKPMEKIALYSLNIFRGDKDVFCEI